jgi:hypothetical protein
MPPYLLFHWQYVGELTPCLPHTSATGFPESPSVKIDRIWLSVKRDFFTA